MPFEAIGPVSSRSGLMRRKRRPPRPLRRRILRDQLHSVFLQAARVPSSLSDSKGTAGASVSDRRSPGGQVKLTCVPFAL